VTRRRRGVRSPPSLPGVYRNLWSYSVGDCGGGDYILDKDRMLEISECKYGFEVVLYNRGHSAVMPRALMRRA
jgi:hypothetical protein